MTSDADWAGLQAADPQQQEETALRLYRGGPPEKLAARPEVMTALRRSVAQGNTSAASLLLLAYDPAPEATSVLEQALRNAGQSLTKLEAWGAAVPLALAARVALARRGQATALHDLLAAIETAGVPELHFLLDVLREVDNPTTLHAVARALDDDRPVPGVGAPYGVESPRRLEDLAVDALVRRLHLPVSFPLKSAERYSPQEVAEVKTLLAGSIPH